MCSVHDPELLEVLPTLNKEPGDDLKEWKEKGWKEKCHEGWLNEFPREGKPGRAMLIEGLQGKLEGKDTAGSRL